MNRYTKKWRLQNQQRRRIKWTKVVKSIMKQMGTPGGQSREDRRDQDQERNPFNRCMENIKQILETTRLNIHRPKPSMELTYFHIEESQPYFEEHHNVARPSVHYFTKPTPRLSIADFTSILSKVAMNIPKSSSDTPSEIKPPDYLKNLQLSAEPSSLYCTGPNQTVYHITFVARNVRMSPLYLEKRPVPDFPLEKQSQSEQECVYKAELCKTSSRAWLLRKLFFFRTGRKKMVDLQDRRTPPVKIYSGYRCHDDRKKRPSVKKERISGMIRNIKEGGYINLLWENSKYKIEVGSLEIESLRPLVKKSTIPNFDGTTLYNVASVNARYKNDIVQFRFELQKVNIQIVCNSITRANQVEDEYAYIPYFCKINERRVILALPISHYSYRDPMIPIFRNNRHNRLHKCDPKWLTDSRRQKQMMALSEDFQTVIGLISESSQASVLVVELNEELYKFRCDTLSTLKVPSVKKYESFVVERQRETLALSSNLSSFVKGKEATIPDWDYQNYYI